MQGATNARTHMTKIRLNSLLFAILTVLLAPPAFAQGYNTSDSDQPGYIPSEAEEQLPPEYQRTAVFYRTSEAPGTIIISTSERYLYVVQGDGRALRYGIGVGREGFQWQGLLKISRKQEWPDWTPPPEMIERQPYLPRFMAGRPRQPAWRARALSRRNRLPHSRHQRASNHRHRRLVGMLPSGQRRRHRSV